MIGGEKSVASQSAAGAGGKKVTGFRMDQELAKEFKVRAVQLGRDYGECAEEALKDWLKKHKKK